MIDHVLYTDRTRDLVDPRFSQFRGSRARESHAPILHVRGHRAKTETTEFADSICDDLVDLSLQLRIGNLRT